MDGSRGNSVGILILLFFGHIIMSLGIGNCKCETDVTNMRSVKQPGKDSPFTDLMFECKSPQIS